MTDKEQLTLAFEPTPPRYSRSDFVEVDDGISVLSTADSWRASAAQSLIICGPAAAGKTHLSHIIANGVEGPVLRVSAAQLGSRPASGLWLIDDMHLLSDTHAFLHMLEQIKGTPLRLVLCGRGQPSQWAGGLVDLQTRLEAMARITMLEPDEALMAAVLGKNFRDRQMRVPDEVITYAIPRLPCTFLAATRFVVEVERLVNQDAGKVTKNLAKSVIDKLCGDN